MTFDKIYTLSNEKVILREKEYDATDNLLCK